MIGPQLHTRTFLHEDISRGTIHMKPGCKSIFTKVGKSEEEPKSHTSHTSPQCPLLSVKTVRPYSFVSHQMKLFILIRYRFLEILSHSSCAALVISDSSVFTG